jgi:hypothetical protein
LNALRNLSAAALAAMSSVASTAVHATEEPKYRIVQSHEVFEVRQYEPYTVAEVVVPGPADKAGNQGFSILAAYIFGKNKGATKMEMTARVRQTPAPMKLPMTAPVTQSATPSGFLVQFVMPRAFTMATLPEPTDPRIVLREVGRRRHAVIRYSGSSGQANYNKHLDQLRSAVERAAIATHGEPVFSRYDAPYVPPFLRRNEIWLEATQASPAHSLSDPLAFGDR